MVDSKAKPKISLKQRVVSVLPAVGKMALWLGFFVLVSVFVLFLFASGILTSERPEWLNNAFHVARWCLYAFLCYRIRGALKDNHRVVKLVVGGILFYELIVVHEVWRYLWS